MPQDVSFLIFRQCEKQFCRNLKHIADVHKLLIQKWSSFKVYFGLTRVGVDSRTFQRKSSRDMSRQVKVEKLHKNICQVFLKRLQSSPIILERRMYSSRDVKNIFIENVYFPMYLKGMGTRKLSTKPADIRTLMPNESLGNMCLYYICKKMFVLEKWHVSNQKNKEATRRK